MSSNHSHVYKPHGWARTRRRPQPYERPTVRHFTLCWTESTPKTTESYSGGLAAEARTLRSIVIGNLMSTPTQSETQVAEEPPRQHFDRRMSPVMSSPVINFLTTVSMGENACERKTDELSPKNKSNSKHFETHHGQMPNDGTPVSHPSSPFQMPIPEKTKFKPSDHSTPLQTISSCGSNTSVNNGRKVAVRSLTSPLCPDICHPTEGAQEEDPFYGTDTPLVKHGKRRFLRFPSKHFTLWTPSPRRSHICPEHQTEYVEPSFISEDSHSTSGEQPQAGPEIQVNVQEVHQHEKLSIGETRKTKRKRREMWVPVLLCDSSDGQRAQRDITLYDVYFSLATEIIELKRPKRKSEAKQALECFYEEVVKSGTRIIDDIQKRYVDKLHEMDEERKKIKALRMEFDRLGKILERCIKEKNVQGLHPYTFCFSEQDDWL